MLVYFFCAISCSIFFFDFFWVAVVCMYVCMCICMYVYIYIYIYRMVISREVRALCWKAVRAEVMSIHEDGGATVGSLVLLSGVNKRSGRAQG